MNVCARRRCLQRNLSPAQTIHTRALGEITLDEFKIKQQNLRQAAEDQKAIELEIKNVSRHTVGFLVCARLWIKNFLFQ